MFSTSINSKQVPDQVSFSPLTRFPLDLFVDISTVFWRLTLSRIRDYKGFNIAVNDDHAIVGRVMSDGVLITLDSSIESYELCIRV